MCHMDRRRYRRIIGSVVRSWPTMFFIGPRESLVSFKGCKYVLSSAPYLYTVVSSKPTNQAVVLGRSNPVSQVDLPEIADPDDDDEHLLAS